jgi:hypothetical protein
MLLEVAGTRDCRMPTRTLSPSWARGLVIFTHKQQKSEGPADLVGGYFADGDPTGVIQEATKLLLIGRV